MSIDEKRGLLSTTNPEEGGGPSSPTIPVDGAHAYLIAVCVALTQMTVLGTFTCFPVYLHEWENEAKFGFPSQTTLSSAQSIVLGLIPTVGVLAGLATDKYGPRVVLGISSLSLLAMNLLTPFAESIGSFIAIYSITMGLACACLTAPGPAALGTWFSHQKMSFGVGIGEAGAAAGTCVMPVIAGALLLHFGDWRVSLRWMGCFSVIPLTCSCFLKRRDGWDLQEEEEMGDFPSLGQNLKSKNFFGLFLGQLFFALAYFGLLFIAIPFAREFGEMGPHRNVYSNNESISLEKASTLLTFFGAANGVGAILLGLLASKLNNRIVFSVAMIICAICFGFWTIATKYVELALLFFIMGFMCAGALACLPSMVVGHFLGPDLNVIMSLSYVGFGIGGLVAPPLTSALKGSDGSYTVSIAVLAGSLFLASVSVFGLVTEPAHPGEEEEGDVVEESASSAVNA